jgi:hypothetical protein
LKAAVGLNVEADGLKAPAVVFIWETGGGGALDGLKAGLMYLV